MLWKARYWQVSSMIRNPAIRAASSIRCGGPLRPWPSPSNAPRALPSVEPEKPPAARKVGRRLESIADIAVLEADEYPGQQAKSRRVSTLKCLLWFGLFREQGCSVLPSERIGSRKASPGGC